MIVVSYDICIPISLPLLQQFNYGDLNRLFI